jgi:hypothetical protein
MGAFGTASFATTNHLLAKCTIGDGDNRINAVGMEPGEIRRWYRTEDSRKFNKDLKLFLDGKIGYLRQDMKGSLG